MKQRDNMHMHDTELQALSRRGYQGGMPIELLSDAFLFEENGNYFHTVDGRFAKVWKIQGVDASLLDNDQLYAVTEAFAEVLNKYPENSCGQFIRHTHRDIRDRMETYRDGLDQDAGEFTKAIADSILDRQYNAAVSPNGFFAKLTTNAMRQMRDEAMASVNNMDDDVKSNLSKSINREINEGRFPYVTDFYLTFLWEPSYMFGKFIDKTWKSGMASMGLADADKLAFEAYTKHVGRFGDNCNQIAQALAALGFRPEELTGQGFINLQYKLMNPVRSYNIDAPLYRPDLPIYECLKNPSLVSNGQALNNAPMFAHVVTTNKGWTIHDTGREYHIRSTSLLGKPGKSAPGMLQIAMTGIESECLATVNWVVPSKLVVLARNTARGRLISAKKTMHLGDKELIQAQSQDLDAVKASISSENVTNRQQMFDVSLHVNMMGFNAERLEDLTEKLESLLWRMGKAETLRGDAVTRSSMPLNYIPKSRTLLRRDTPHLTRSLSHLCPLFVEYQGVDDPAIVMNNRDGQPIFLDLWGRSVNTAHSLIVGTTGSGKSFTFNNILMGARAKYRPKVWIIDKGDSYESLCLVLGGNYVRLATEPFPEPITGRTIYPICINPFWLASDEEGNAMMPSLDDIMFMANMLVMMMTTGNGEKNAVVHPKTRPLLYKALQEFFAQWVEVHPTKEPMFSDFIPHLQKSSFTDLGGEDIAEKLTLYFGQGAYSALFDGKLQVDWDNDFTVLEIQRMAKSDALGIVTLALFRQIDLYCKFKLDRGRKKLIAVDEAWATLSSPTSAAALASFYRELRRYGAGCLLISQTVNDFVSIIKAEANGASDTQDGILENTSHYFFLACSESDYKIAQSELAFTNEEVDLWRSLASLPPIYSEVFYRMRTAQGLYYSGVFRLFASSVSLWIASSHPDDFSMREKKTQEIVHSQNVNESIARQRAIVALAKEFPYGARFHVEDAA